MPGVPHCIHDSYAGQVPWARAVDATAALGTETVDLRQCRCGPMLSNDRSTSRRREGCPCARLVTTVLAAVTLSAGFVVSAANAQARVCHRLWVERNPIYADYGYCFKTERAIRYFGNRGCRYEYEGDMPMSRRDRARVKRIQAEERRYGCR